MYQYLLLTSCRYLWCFTNWNNKATYLCDLIVLEIVVGPRYMWSFFTSLVHNNRSLILLPISFKLMSYPLIFISICMYACVFMFYSSVSHHFVECVFVFMQAVVDEWASSLFRVCIGFLVFSSKLCSSIAWCSCASVRIEVHFLCNNISIFIWYRSHSTTSYWHPILDFFFSLKFTVDAN